jgi:hypothetical protein
LKALDQVRHLAFVYRVGAHFKIGTVDCLLGFYKNAAHKKEQENE